MKTKEFIVEDKILLDEWNWARNNKLKLNPASLTLGSNKKAWWKCSKCSYEWQSVISNRATLHRGCPCCANKIVVKGINDLATVKPNIAKEWHLTKNGNLTPSNVTYGCGKKVWWICPVGHEYQATINHRTGKNGTGCPTCFSGRQTSFAEQATYYYVKKLYPDAINRYKADFLGKMELDIYIPSINFAIEYDGEAWHKKDRLKSEQNKYKICEQNGIKLIRLREKFAELGSDIADKQYGIDKLYEHKNLELVISQLLATIDFSDWGHSFCRSVDINIERDKLEIQKYMTGLKNNSFADLYPELSKEWHPAKNGTLKPEMFKPYSDNKVWWICPICKYEYQSTIGHRAYGTGCPMCGIKKSTIAKCKKVAMLDLKTYEVIKNFASISEASRQTKINSSNISMVCNGQRNNAGGFGWKYIDKNQL